MQLIDFEWEVASKMMDVLAFRLPRHGGHVAAGISATDGKST